MELVSRWTWDGDGLDSVIHLPKIIFFASQNISQITLGILMRNLRVLQYCPLLFPKQNKTKQKFKIPVLFQSMQQWFPEMEYAYI